MNLPTPDAVQVTLTSLTIVGVLVGWIKVLRPKWRHLRDRIVAVFDTLAGRPPVHDPATGQTLPALPPLNERLGSLEVAMTKLVDVMAVSAEHGQQLGEHAAALIDHARRIGDLEHARLERVTAQQESTEMWRAVANRDAIDGEAAEPSGEL